MQGNYFELFGLPMTLSANKESVRRSYVNLSKKYHPDYFVNKDVSQQENALEMSALLNKAFKTLSNQEDTIAYVLELKGLLQENEKYDLPTDFLMEMLEVNETLSEALLNENENTTRQLRNQLEELEKGLYEPVKEIIENYREGITTPEELLQVKEYYFKKKYLNRLYQQLNRML